MAVQILLMRDGYKDLPAGCENPEQLPKGPVGGFRIEML